MSFFSSFVLGFLLYSFSAVRTLYSSKTKEQLKYCFKNPNKVQSTVKYMFLVKFTETEAWWKEKNIVAKIKETS